VSVTEAVSAGILRRRMAGQLARAFERQGREGTAALDARLLLAHVLKIDAAELALRDDQPIDAGIQAMAEALVEKRIAGLPVARLVGRCEFFGMEFEIGPDTLVPRPDSETLVEAALAFCRERPVSQPPPTVADLGTGSGILVLALLKELPGARGVGVDIAAGALEVARGNAVRLGLGERVRFVLGDWGSALTGDFDVILANPPYIESDAIAGLQVEVALHDPHIALDGGTDGLAAYRAILADLDRLLAPDGRAFMEIGFDQAYAIAELARSHGFASAFHRDLGGIERVAELRRLTEV
jgi:release factor glutamine methyltransferase